MLLIFRQFPGRQGCPEGFPQRLRCPEEVRGPLRLALGYRKRGEPLDRLNDAFLESDLPKDRKAFAQKPSRGPMLPLLSRHMPQVLEVDTLPSPVAYLPVQAEGFLIQ